VYSSPPDIIDRGAFASAKTAGTVESWTAFLKLYPNGPLAERARQERDKLQTPQIAPKISDDADQAGQDGSSATARVVLYEDDPADPRGKPYTGSVLWRTETKPSIAGQRPETSIPDRRIKISMLFRRNVDKALPASHTIEIMFNVPAGFRFGGISNVPGILMKQAEKTRGSPLAGLAVKVSSGYFLIGVSGAEDDLKRNVELLKDRAWFDIPFVYSNGRRAILAIEKGMSGQQAFAEAFAKWNQDNAPLVVGGH
jgi:hypothetical protein